MNTLEDIRASVEVVNGEEHMRDAKGRLTPLSLVKAQDQLRDEMIRKCLGYAIELHQQIARFRDHCMDDIEAFLALQAQEYGVTMTGGAKGNMTFTSYDGCLKMQVAIADQITFGDELQAAKLLIDECILEWAAGSRGEIRALVDHAFEPRKEGKVNREALIRLRSLDIEDDRWKRAMEAIKAAERPVGSKQYIRFYTRQRPDHPWRHVTIDLASAGPSEKAEG